MKKFIIFLVLTLGASGFAFAQSPRAALDKVKEIRLLESNRDDVKRILADYESSDGDDYSQDFSKDDWDIEVFYSKGYCSQDNDDDEEDSGKWNIPEGTVREILISPPESIKPDDLGYNLSELKKEQRYANIEDFYVYYSKKLGVYIEAHQDEVQTILLFPPDSNISRACDDNEDVKKFYSSEEWFGDTKLEDRVYSPHGDTTPNVTDLTLSATEITTGCKNAAESDGCPDEAKEISVKTVSIDPENDVLTYNYTVSGGKIIGKGAEVVWDLTDVKPGTYTITAGVDDGCGVCGQTMTREVVVKECPNCSSLDSEKVLPVKTEFRHEAEVNKRSAETRRETRKTSRRVSGKSRTKIRKSPPRRLLSPAERRRKNKVVRSRTKIKL